jgi:spore maturation protein CgeB
MPSGSWYSSAWIRSKLTAEFEITSRHPKPVRAKGESLINSKLVASTEENAVQMIGGTNQAKLIAESGYRAVKHRRRHSRRAAEIVPSLGVRTSHVPPRKARSKRLPESMPRNE